MNTCFFVIALLHLSLATAVNFTQVFEWPDGMDYEWPSEADRAQALKDGTFKPEKIEPIFMAVYGTRIFLSLYKYSDIPASLVSLPTRSAASPKLTPFPSWDMHGIGDCNRIEVATGVEVDSVGRLWVLDSGSDNCNAKLWTIDLSNNDRIELMHRFSFRYFMHDFVLDETPNGTLAIVTNYGAEHIVVFSLERNQSWIVQTPGLKSYSVALSPKEEPRQLYVSYWNTNVLFSISVTELRNGDKTANPRQIGQWEGRLFRMLIDSHGTMYAAFWQKNFILSWNTSQPFEEQRFYEVGNLNTYMPFTFALDLSGSLWLTELNKSATKPRYRLLMAAVGAKSYNYENSTVTPASPTTRTISPQTEPMPVTLSILTTSKSWTPAEKNATTEVQESSILSKISNEAWIIITLICSNLLLSLIIIWLVLRQRRINLTPQTTNEAQQISVIFEKNEDVAAVEVQCDANGSQSRPLRLIFTRR